MVVEYHVQMCRFLPDWSDMKVHHICYVTANFQMWEKSGLWDMDQNASWHHAPWTVGRNLMKPPEFFMVMSIFLKWMPGSNDMGRWQGGVIDSSLTFSFFQSFLLTTKAKRKKEKMRKSFSSKEVFQLTCLHLYWPIYHSYFAVGMGNSSLFYTLKTWKISIVQIESIFHGQI